MRQHPIRKVAILTAAILLLATQVWSETRYDRDLVVKDETRAMKVEKVFKELIAAYEDEDPQGFLDLVSDDRFRQDYITFTDALYNDFRTYEIHRVDYWIDRVVSDHIKQFLFVKWEKRYEFIDNGTQQTMSGYSRFLFDEVNGKYLLIELAGNPLFGGSLQDWVDETPPISGQVAKTETTTPGSSGATNEMSCTSTGGYWANGSCYTTQKQACEASNRYWVNNMCSDTQPQPDLSIIDILKDESMSVSEPKYLIYIENVGDISSGNYTVTAAGAYGSSLSQYGTPLSPNERATITIDTIGSPLSPPVTITVTQTDGTPEKTTVNNSTSI